MIEVCDLIARYVEKVMMVVVLSRILKMVVGEGVV